MRTFTPTILLLFLSLSLQAQQFSLPSQLNRNLVYLNPSFTGIYETTVANLMHRSVWLNGIDGSPNYQNFEFHSPLKKQSVALGLQARHEQAGATSNTEVFFNYAHRITMGSAKLALGVKGGFHSSSMAAVSLEQGGVVDPAFEASKSQMIPNFGFGASYYTKNYYVGLSIPYFLSSISGSDGNVSIDFNMNNFQYLLTAGGSFSINSVLDIEPVGAFVYSMLLQPTYSVIVNAKYNNMILAGVGYRAQEALILNVGYQFNNQLSFMYSYDYNIGDVSSFSSGSHEIGLLLYWGFEVNTISPRDF